MCKLTLVLILASFIGANAEVNRPSYSLSTKSDNNSQNEITQNETSAIDYRLPDVYKVNDYIIFMDVYLDENDQQNKNFTFTGVVTMNFELKNDVKKIIFHNEGLIILDYNLNKTNEARIDDLELGSEPMKNFSIIKRKTREDLTAGNYSLNISYSGKISNDSRGFYMSTYTNAENRTM